MPVLNDVAKEEGIETIYYWSVKDTSNKNMEYLQKVTKLEGTPTLYYINDGEVVDQSWDAKYQKYFSISDYEGLYKKFFENNPL